MTRRRSRTINSADGPRKSIAIASKSKARSIDCGASSASSLPLELHVVPHQRAVAKHHERRIIGRKVHDVSRAFREHEITRHLAKRDFVSADNDRSVIPNVRTIVLRSQWGAGTIVVSGNKIA